ncbi:MAG: hypothetical protein Q4D37_10135 [Oscillospiraceae bacterium]|nr:hypothetical protein [Oscillospiraceae bacterium]
MYFENYKELLSCMEAFHSKEDLPEVERYAAALEQLLYVVQQMQNAANRAGKSDKDLEAFDYVDVKDWLLTDWLSVFIMETDMDLFQRINTFDYAVWGYESPEAYWQTLQTYFQNTDEKESE